LRSKGQETIPYESGRTPQRRPLRSLGTGKEEISLAVRFPSSSQPRLQSRARYIICSKTQRQQPPCDCRAQGEQISLEVRFSGETHTAAALTALS